VLYLYYKQNVTQTKELKMKLYHGTKKENKESILEYGLEPQVSNKLNSEGVRLEGEFVYGFENIEDAINFMVYDNNTPEEDIAVFEFISESPIKDVEYDDGAYAHKTVENVEAKIVKIEAL
jgi:hypothetical protein